MSFLADFFSIVLGRWILARIGFFVRRSWYIVSNFLHIERSGNVKSELNHVINVDEFKNRIVGLVVIIALLIFLKIII